MWRHKLGLLLKHPKRARVELKCLKWCPNVQYTLEKIGVCSISANMMMPQVFNIHPNYKFTISAQEVPKWCPKCSIFTLTSKFGKYPKNTWKNIMLKCSLFTQASNLASAQEVPKWCPKCSIFNQTTKFGESPKKNAPSVQYSTKLQY